MATIISLPVSEPLSSPERRLRVLRVIPVLDFGGVESMVVQWARLVDPDRYDTRVCTFWKPGRAAAEVRAAGTPVDCLEQDPAVRNARATAALFRYLRRVRPDVLHCAIAEANFHGLWTGRAARVPRIILEETGVPERSRLGRLAYALTYRLCDGLVCVCDATARYVCSEELAPASKVRVIYNSMDESFLGPVDRKPSQADVLRVLAIGRLEPVKNFDGLLRAFRAVVAAFPGAKLAIVGDGPERFALEQLRGKLGLKRHVEFLGFRTDIRALHLQADLFVLPSHSEGLSVALLEAMASGLPVLVSDRGGNPEVVRDLGANVRLDPRDPKAWAEAILRFACLPPEARLHAGVMARAAVVERFCPSVYMKAMDDIYLDRETNARKKAHSRSRPTMDSKHCSSGMSSSE